MRKRREARSLAWQSKDDKPRRQLFLKVDFCFYLTRLRSAITPIAAAGERGEAVPCSFSPSLLKANPKGVFAMDQEAFS